MSNKLTPNGFIKKIRDSFPGSEYIYTNGACYQLFEILKSVFPQAYPVYDPDLGHVYTVIDGNYYDIRGKVDDIDSDGLARLDAKLHRNAKKWSKQTFKELPQILEDFFDDY